MLRTPRQLDMISRPWSFKLLEVASPLAGFRFAKRLIPWFRSTDLNVSCLPINEDIDLPENTVLPVQILEDFIRRASHRVVVDFCACRKAMSCKRYPHETGCLMMGRSALEIHPDVCREVSVVEALDHSRNATEKGLVPFIGKARIDNLIFGIKNKKQLLSVCFCCDCCCISRFARHVPAASRLENVRRLEGLHLEIGDECDACGACENRCFLSEIKIEGGRAVIGEGCAGCGRCASVCTRGAIKISIQAPTFLEEARTRIEGLVDIH